MRFIIIFTFMVEMVDEGTRAGAIQDDSGKREMSLGNILVSRDSLEKQDREHVGWGKKGFYSLNSKRKRLSSILKCCTPPFLL